MDEKTVFPFLRLRDITPEPAAVNLLPERLARHYTLAPLWLEEERLVIACANPLDQPALKAVMTTARRPVRQFQATVAEIRLIQSRVYREQPIPFPTPGLVEALYRLGHLDEEGSQRAQVEQTRLGWSLVQTMLRLDLVNEIDLAETLGWLNFLPHISLESLTLQPDLAPLIPWETAKDIHILPLGWFEGILLVGVPDLDHEDQVKKITDSLGIPAWPVICLASEWDHLYRQFYLRGSRVETQRHTTVVDYLLQKGFLSETDLMGAQALSQQMQRPLEEILQDRGLVSREDWLSAVSQTIGIQLERLPRKKARSSQYLKELASLLPASIASAFAIVPLERQDGSLILGMKKPDRALVRMVESITRLPVEPRLVSSDDFESQLKNFYGILHAIPYQEPVPQLEKLLLFMGVVTKDQIEQAKGADLPKSKSLGERLVQLDYLNESGLIEALSILTGIPSVRLDHARFDEGLVRSIPIPLVQGHTLLPLCAVGDDLWVVMADPFDGAGLLAVEQATGKRVWPLLAPRSALQATIARFFSRDLRSLSYEIHQLMENLVNAGYLTQMEASTALHNYASGSVPLDLAIADASAFAQVEVVREMAKVCEVSFIDLQLQEEVTEVFDPIGRKVQKTIIRDPVEAITAQLISLEAARRLVALPFARSGYKVSVAFANPDFSAAVSELENTFGMKVQASLAARKDLEDAIQRHLGRKNIGTYLLMAGIITRKQLNSALDLARRSGVRLGRALIDRGYVSQEQLYKFLAEQANLPLFDLEQVELKEEIVRLIDPLTARNYGILPIAADEANITLATVDPLNSEALQKAAEITSRMVHPVLVTERNFESALERIYQEDYLARSISELLERSPEDSAYRVLSLGQKIFLLVFVLLSILWLALEYRSYIIILNTIASVFYLGFSAYKFYLVYRALGHDLEVPVEKTEVDALDERNLPVYTILIPVYREAEVLPELIEAVDNLDYPATKLDIKVLMEADDVTTLKAFYHIQPPAHFQGIVVPTAEPKTKPKACNYGLIHARGDYVVIFDAEDLPEPDQLKKVVVAFSKVPKDVVCIQSKLNYYNSDQNVLTRWFTVEYSMWFDLFLPGLDASRMPIPLGGTSNHFRREALIEAGAWDPYNVTEDADLGIRMYKRGFKTAIVDSTTFEEANSNLYNWIRQRSRWIKGYIQTWLVHMRHPFRLIDEIGWKAFISFQFVVGGTFFAALMNPIYWALTTIWFFVKWPFIQKIFPGPVFYIGAICLFLGNFAFTYMNVAGAMRRNYYGFVKYALLSPFYWGLASVAGWKGFLQLFSRPHFWEKTEHGLVTDLAVEEEARSKGMG